MSSSAASLPSGNFSQRGVDWATLKTAASDADNAQARRLFSTLSSKESAPKQKSSAKSKPNVAPIDNFLLSSGTAALPSLSSTLPSTPGAASGARQQRPNTTNSAHMERGSAAAISSVVSPLRSNGGQLGLTRAAMGTASHSQLLQDMGAGTSDGLFSPPVPRRRANSGDRLRQQAAQSASVQRSHSPPLPSRTVEEAVAAALPGQAARQRSVKGSHAFGRAVVSSDVHALVTKAVSILGAASALARAHITGAPQVLQLPGGEFTVKASPAGTVLSSMAHLDRDFSTVSQDVVASAAEALGSDAAVAAVVAAAPAAMRHWTGARFRSKWAHSVSEEIADQVSLSSSQQGSMLRQVAATNGEVVHEMQAALSVLLQALYKSQQQTTHIRADLRRAEERTRQAQANAANVAMASAAAAAAKSPAGAAAPSGRLAPLARDAAPFGQTRSNSPRMSTSTSSGHKGALKAQLDALGSEVASLRFQLASTREQRDALEGRLETSLPKEREYELLTQLRAALAENTRLQTQAAQQRELLDELLAKEAKRRMQSAVSGATEGTVQHAESGALHEVPSDEERDTTAGSTPAMLPVVGQPELHQQRLLNPMAPTVGGGDLAAGSPAVENALVLLPRSHGGDSSSLPVHKLALTRGARSGMRKQLRLPTEDEVDAAVHTHKIAALAVQKRTHEVPCLVFRSLLPGLFGRPRPPLRMSAAWVRWVSRSLLLAKAAADAQAELGGAQRQRFPEFVWAWFDSGAARATALAAGLMLPPSVLLGGGDRDTPADNGAKQGASTVSAVSLKAARSLAANSALLGSGEGTHSVASLATHAWRRGLTASASGGKMGLLGDSLGSASPAPSSSRHAVAGRDALAQVAHMAGAPAGGGDAVALPASLSHPTDVAQRAEVVALLGAQQEKSSGRQRHSKAGRRSGSSSRRAPVAGDAASGSDNSDTESVGTAGTQESLPVGGSSGNDYKLAFHDVWSLMEVMRTQDGFAVTDDDLRWAWYYGLREISSRSNFETQPKGFYAGQAGGYAALSKQPGRPSASGSGATTSPSSGKSSSERKSHGDHEMGFDVAEPAEQGSIEATLMYNWLDERHGSDELAFAQHALDVLVGVLPKGRLGWGPDASSCASIGTAPLVLWLAAVAEGGYSGVGSSAAEEHSVVQNALLAAEHVDAVRPEHTVGFVAGRSSSGAGGASTSSRNNRPPPASAMHTTATPQARALAAQGGSMQRTAQFLGAAQLLGGRGPGGTRVKLSSAEQAAATATVPTRVAASFLASSTATAAELVPVNSWVWAQHAVDATRRLFVRLPSAERRRIVRNVLAACVPATGARIALLRRHMGGEQAASAGRHGPAAGIGTQGDQTETHSPLRAAADEARRTGGRAKRAQSAAPLPCVDLFALLQLWCVEFRQEQAHRSAMLRVLYDTAVMHTVAATSALATKASAVQRGPAEGRTAAVDLAQVGRLTSVPPDTNAQGLKQTPPATPLKQSDGTHEEEPLAVTLRDSRLWRARSDLLPVGQIAVMGGTRGSNTHGSSDPRSTDLGDRSATALVQLTVDVQQVGVMLRSIAPWLPPGEVAAVYREAMQWGAGSVTLPALMAACESRQVFTRSLLLSPYTHRGLLSLSEELPSSPALLLRAVEAVDSPANHIPSAMGPRSASFVSSPGVRTGSHTSPGGKPGLHVDVGIAMSRGGGASTSLQSAGGKDSPTHALRSTHASAVDVRTAAAAQAVLLASASASLAHALNSRYRMLTDDIGGWLSSLPLQSQLRAGAVQARVRAELRAALDPLASTVVGTAAPVTWWALLGDLGDTSVLSISSLAQEARATLKRIQRQTNPEEVGTHGVGIAGRARTGTFASLGGSTGSGEETREEPEGEGLSISLPTAGPATGGVGVNEDDIEMLRLRDGLRVLPAYRRYLLTLLSIRAESREGTGEVALGAIAKQVGLAVARGGAWGSSGALPLAIVRGAAAWVGGVERECEVLESMLREESSGPTAAILRQSSTRLALASTAVVSHDSTPASLASTAARAGGETPIAAGPSPLHRDAEHAEVTKSGALASTNVLDVFDELLASENGSFTNAQMKRNRTLRKLHNLCLAAPVGSPLWLSAGTPLWLMSALAWAVDSLLQDGEDDAPAAATLAKGVRGGSFGTAASLTESLQFGSTADDVARRWRIRPALLQASDQPSLPANGGAGEGKRKRRSSAAKKRARRNSVSSTHSGSASVSPRGTAEDVPSTLLPAANRSGAELLEGIAGRGMQQLHELRTQLLATELSPAAVLGDPSFVAGLLQVLLGGARAGSGTPLGARIFSASMGLPLESAWGTAHPGAIAASSSLVQLHRATTSSERITAVMQGVSVVRIQRAVRQHLLFPSGVPPLRRKQVEAHRSNLFGGLRRVTRPAGSAFVPPPGLALVGAGGGGDSELAASGAIPSGAIVSMPPSSGERGAPDAAAHAQAQAALGRAWQILAGCIGAPSYSQAVSTGHGAVAAQGISRDMYRILYMALRKVAQTGPIQRSAPLAYVATLARASDAAAQVADKLQQYSQSISMAGAAASQLLFGEGDSAGGVTPSRGGAGTAGAGSSSSYRSFRVSSLRLTAASTSPQFPLLSAVELLSLLAGILDSWARLGKPDASASASTGGHSGVAATSAHASLHSAQPPCTLSSLASASRRTRVAVSWTPPNTDATPDEEGGVQPDVFNASSFPALQRLRAARGEAQEAVVAEATQCMGSSLPTFVRWWLHHSVGAAQWGAVSAETAAHNEVVDALEHAVYRSVRHWAPHHHRARLFAILCGIPVIAAPRPDGGFSCTGGSPSELAVLRKAVEGGIPRHDEFGSTRASAAGAGRAPPTGADDPLLSDLAMQGVWQGVLSSSAGTAAASLGGLGWARGVAASSASPLNRSGGLFSRRRPGDMWDSWRRGWSSTHYGSALSVGTFVRLPSDFHPALRGGATLTAALPHALVASGVRAFPVLRDLDDSHRDVVTRARLLGAQASAEKQDPSAKSKRDSSQEEGKNASITLDSLPGVAQAAVGQGFASWSCQAGAWWTAPTGDLRPSAVPHRPLAARSLDTAQSRLASSGVDADGSVSPGPREGKRAEPWYQGGISADGTALPVLTPQDQEWELQREMACDDALVFYGELLLLLHAHGAALARGAAGQGLIFGGGAQGPSTGGVAATPAASLRSTAPRDESLGESPSSPMSAGATSEASFDLRDTMPAAGAPVSQPRLKVQGSQVDLAHCMFPLPVCWSGATPPSTADKGPRAVAPGGQDAPPLTSLGGNAVLSGGADTSNGREGASGAYFPSPAEIEAGQYASSGAQGLVPLGAAKAVVASLMPTLLGATHGRGEEVARKLQEALQGIAFSAETSPAADTRNPPGPPLSSNDTEGDPAVAARQFTEAQGVLTWVSVDDVAWAVMRAWARDRLEAQYAMGAAWVQSHVLSPLARHVTHSLTALQKVAQVQRDHEALFEEERALRRRASTANAARAGRPGSRGSSGGRPSSRDGRGTTPPSKDSRGAVAAPDMFLAPTPAAAASTNATLDVPMPLVPHPLQLLTVVDDAMLVEAAGGEVVHSAGESMAVHPAVWAVLLPTANKWSRTRGGGTAADVQTLPQMPSELAPVLEAAVRSTTQAMFRAGADGRLAAGWRSIVDARVAIFGSASYSPAVAARHTAAAVQGCGAPSGWAHLLTTSVSAAVAHISALAKQTEATQIRLNTAYMDLMALGDPQVVSHYRTTGTAQVRRLGAVQSSLALRLAHALWEVSGVTLNQGSFINQSRQHGAAFLSPGELAGQVLKDARTAAAVGAAASHGGARRASRLQDFLRRGDNLAAAAARQLSSRSAAAGLGSQAAAAAVTGFAPLHHPSSCSLTPLHPRLVGLLNGAKGGGTHAAAGAAGSFSFPSTSACLPAVLAAARRSGLVGITWDSVQCSSLLTPPAVASNAVVAAAAGCPLLVPVSNTSPVILHLPSNGAVEPSAREHSSVHRPLVPDRIRTRARTKPHRPSLQSAAFGSSAVAQLLPAALRAFVEAAVKAPGAAAGRRARHSALHPLQKQPPNTAPLHATGVPRTPVQAVPRNTRSPASRASGSGEKPASLPGHRRSRSQPVAHPDVGSEEAGAAASSSSLRTPLHVVTSPAPTNRRGGGGGAGSTTMGALARDIVRALHRSCALQAGKVQAGGGGGGSQGLLLGRTPASAARTPSYGTPATEDGYTQWHSTDGSPCAFTHAEFLAQRYVVEAVSAVVMPLANLAAGVLSSAVEDTAGVPASLKPVLQAVYALWRGLRAVKGGFDVEERAMIRGWVGAAGGTGTASTSAASRNRRAQRSVELLSALHKQRVGLQSKVLRAGGDGGASFEEPPLAAGPHVSVQSSLLLAHRDALGHVVHLLQHTASLLPCSAFVGRAAGLLMSSALGGAGGTAPGTRRKRGSSAASSSDVSSVEDGGAGDEHSPYAARDDSSAVGSLRRSSTGGGSALGT